MSRFWEDEFIKQIGEEVLFEHEVEFKNIIDNKVKIGWLKADKEKKSKSRHVHADCRKVPEDWSWCCPYDFLITVYAPNVQHMDVDQMHTLLWHELKHVGVETGPEEPRLYIRPHDMEDFRDIIEQKGLDWDR